MIRKLKSGEYRLYSRKVDAKTGRDLWQIQTNASTELGDGHSWRASPMTFMAGGKQYIAVAAGPNILCFGLP